jgi:hypothetical protein
MSRLFIMAVLHWLSRPVALSLLPCPCCLDVIFWSSRSLFWHIILTVLSGCTVLAVLLLLSCPGSLSCPCCPALAVFSWLSRPGCSDPGLFSLALLSRLSFLYVYVLVPSVPGRTVQVDLSWLSCSRCSVLDVQFQTCPVMAILHWLSRPGCPVLNVLS